MFGIGIRGSPADYPGNINGGYLEQRLVRIRSAISARKTCARCSPAARRLLLDDFHIDGLRVDLTDAIHQNNTLNYNGASIGSANLYGIKFLRELARTVKMVNPAAFLIAEDHTGWSAMTQSLDQGRHRI